MDEYLILIGIIIVFGIFMENISKKIGIPALLFFLIMGIASGNGIFLNNFTNKLDVIEKICSIALIFIMFYGGFGTNVKYAKSVIKKSIFLASIGVFISIFVLSLFLHYVLKFSFSESFLLSSVLGSTDAASVFNILRYKNLSLKNNLDSLLEIESGSNDPFAYICTLIAILNIKGGLNIYYSLFFFIKQILIAIFVAIMISKIYIFILNKFLEKNEEFNQIFLISTAILSYAVSNILGGNGYLCTYIVGINIGKIDFENKYKTVHFFDGVTSLMQLLLFYLLGLLINPIKLINVSFYGVFIMLFLIFVARPISIFPIFRDFKNLFTISFAGIRGAASIVFSMYAINSKITLKNDIYHIVAVVVILSIVIQGGFLSFVIDKMNMLDKGGNILKTFNDYVYDKKIRFIQSDISKGSPWKNKLVKNLHLPNNIRIVNIKRDGKNIVPNGDLKILENDEIILSGIRYKKEVFNVKNIYIYDGHDFENKKILNLNLEENEKIILIERNEKILIPSGNMIIKKDDILLVNQI